MNKIIENLPFLILTSVVPFFFWKDPNIAQSIIVLGVCGLSGYSYHLRNKKKPDLEAIFREQIEKRDLEHYSKISELQKHVNEIRESQGKLSINKVVGERLENFSWDNI